MDTASSEINISQGFSAQETANLLLKKFFWRANTSANTDVTHEPLYQPNIYPDQVVSDAIPKQPPSDFVKLSDYDIAQQFGIGIDEVSQFRTTINGVDVFSIERSSLYPHIYKITNCLLKPFPSNPSLTFTAISSRTKTNILQNSIPFMFGGGAWRGEFRRTATSGELSQSGRDIIRESQFAFIFDSDSGFFTSYEKDCAKNPISSETPPAVSCYVYKGTFGNLSPWKYTGTSGNIYYAGGQVLIGKTTPSDPTLALDVQGVGSIDNLVTTCLETYSDRRLKENITPLELNNNILSLNAYTYNYISKPGNTEIGLVAQETEQLFPMIVKEHNGYKTVQYDRIGVLLLPVVQKQEERIKTLEAELESLKGQFMCLVRKLL
jgi:hypothetical protein